MQTYVAKLYHLTIPDLIGIVLFYRYFLFTRLVTSCSVPAYTLTEVNYSYWSRAL